MNRSKVRFVGCLDGSADSAVITIQSKLFENSSWTLCEADFDIMSLAAVFLNSTPFSDLRIITLEYNGQDISKKCPSLPNAVFRIPIWRHCFPNLQKLTVKRTKEEYAVDLLNELKEKLYRVIMGSNNFHEVEDEEDLGLPSLEEICFPYSRDGEGFLIDYGRFEGEEEFFMKLCRNVKRFSGRVFWGIGRLWREMEYVKSMKLDVAGLDENRLDQMFCGLSEFEHRELLGKQADFLKKVHIVPEETSILHLKSKQVFIPVRKLLSLDI